jgi:hypothetical protein
MGGPTLYPSNVWTYWDSPGPGINYTTLGFFTGHLMQVGTWYKIKTGIYLEPFSESFFSGTCSENIIYVRVKGQELQFSYDGINIIRAVPI